MKKLILAAALGATALAGTTATIATAQTATPAPAGRVAPPPPPPGGPLMHADTDRDGIVTRAEVIADADRRFAALDTNRDGKVTKDERRAEREKHRADRIAHAPPPPGAGAPPPPPPGAGPDRPDRDGPRKHHRGDRMKDRDTTQAQMRDRAVKMFDRIDTNHDGRIDQQERAAAELLMRARMADHDGHRGGPRGDAPPPPAPAPAPSAK